MSKINIEDVKKIAKLAYIKITDEEAAKYAKQIGAILEYVEQLKEVDVEGVEFKSQVDLTNVFRKDVPQEGLTQEEALQNRKKKVKNGNLVISSVL